MTNKPCPFCFQELLRKDLGDGEVEFYHNMDCIFPEVKTIESNYFIEKWNSARVWKEIYRIQSLSDYSYESPNNQRLKK